MFGSGTMLTPRHVEGHLAMWDLRRLAALRQTTSPDAMRQRPDDKSSDRSNS
jgi:hypothetical protein